VAPLPVRVAAIGLAALTLLTAAGGPRPVTVRSANAAAFSYDRWHPEDTVVGSSEVLTRNPDNVTLTVSAVPDGYVARIHATVHNDRPTRIRFPSALRVRILVSRNGGGERAVVLRSAVRSLAPGAGADLGGTMPLPLPGTYEFVGVLSFVPTSSTR
jgi:hypothetical protein